MLIQPKREVATLRSSQRILLVDDDTTLGIAYLTVLRRAGYIVEQAPTGRKALDRLFDENAPAIHLVLLDLGLPDMDGIEVLAEVRREIAERVMPVIVVTGSEGLHERVQGLEAGANDFLVKPVPLPELTARVDAQVRLAANWRDRLRAVTDTRRQLATDLGSVTAAQDIATAAEVVTRAANRISDVKGAAFVVNGERGLVLCSLGDMPLTGGIELADTQLAAFEWLSTRENPFAERAQCGLKGQGTLCVVPFVAEEEHIGLLAISLASSLPTELLRSAVGALEDLSIMASPLVLPIVTREAGEQRRVSHHRRVIADHSFETVFQPIEQLGTRTVVGYEALTRFADGTRPDLAFADAALAGLQVDLERATAFAAIDAAESLPPGAYVGINLSAESLLDIGFLAELTGSDRSLVLEVTEHDAIDDYSGLRKALATVRGHARIAVDDAGAGYAGLHHIRSLRPDIIKLDRSVVRGLDTDPVGRAMVTGMVYFADESGILIVGEGVETEEELATLMNLGVGFGQGFLLGMPQSWKSKDTWSTALENVCA